MQPGERRRRDARATPGPRTRRPVASVVAVAAATLSLTGPAGLAAPAASATSTGSTVELRTDLEGPLFPDVTLAPGDPVHRCMRVGWSGALRDGDVPEVLGLSARASGGLAPALGLRLEVGRGGGADGCEGFEPDAVVFDGSLARLAQQHSTPSHQVGLVSLGSPSGQVVVRTSVLLPDDPGTQGQTATAELVVAVSADGQPGPLPIWSSAPATPAGLRGAGAGDPAVPVDRPTSARPQPPDGPGAAPAPPQTGGAETLRVPLGPAPSGRPAGIDDAADLEPAGLSARQRLEQLTGAGVGQLAAIVTPIARGARRSLWTVPLLLLFLLAQNRLDSRDPKLAGAPTAEPALLGFDPPPPSRGLVGPLGPAVRSWAGSA